MERIVYEPAECECDDATCPHLHSPGWWVDGTVSFETKQEAEDYAAALAEKMRVAREGRPCRETGTQQGSCIPTNVRPIPADVTGRRDGH
jgi:hypothetical protein